MKICTTMSEIQADYEFTVHWAYNGANRRAVQCWCQENLPKDSWHINGYCDALIFSSEQAYCWFVLRWGE